MKIPEKVKNVFLNGLPHQFATSSKDCVPNICNAGAIYLTKDERIILVDNYMNKTCNNLKENNNVSLLIRNGRESYQIKGKAEYTTTGNEYDRAVTWMKAKGNQYPAKGIIVITVFSIFNSMSGSNAGEKVFLD
ncbi:MAG: pyridoxamine 5'-phosphate oxidase family protein [Caldisericia bacterium]|nr:pyridoxamine 5'-phosphate oxidase family protein [Caldisericia bacterium]